MGSAHAHCTHTSHAQTKASSNDEWKILLLQQHTRLRRFPPYVPRTTRSASFQSSRFCYPWGPRLGPARSRLRSMTTAVHRLRGVAAAPHLGPPRPAHARGPRSAALRIRADPAAASVRARRARASPSNSVRRRGRRAGDGLLLLSTTALGRTVSDSRATRSGRYRQSDDGAGWARASPSGARQYM